MTFRISRSVNSTKYIPYPDSNRLLLSMPNKLVEARNNLQLIEYRSLREMHDVICDLADIISNFEIESNNSNDINLKLIFATGGIPYMIPLIQVLATRIGSDYSPFHLFPGLSWRVKIGCKTPSMYFCEQFGKLLRCAWSKKSKLNCFIIDTTFSGNAINKIVKAIYSAYIQEKSTDYQKLSVHIVGLVCAGNYGKLWGHHTKLISIC